MTTLPNKLSELLRLAVWDAVACEQMPETYELNMGLWHSPSQGICRVCMAGAVMAQTLRMHPDDSVSGEPEDHDEDIATDENNPFFAIDSMREGEFIMAAQCIQGSYDGHGREALIAASKIVEDELDALSEGDGRPSRASWSTYLEAADELQRAGL